MSRHAVVIGAGMGGLTAALRLARHGWRVTVFEGAGRPGGLASGFEAQGLRFDGGPYVLLDRPGLSWAFAELGLDLDARVPLSRLEDAYEVDGGERRVRISGRVEATADALERTWPGSGARYRRFVARMAAAHGRLEPLLRRAQPGLLDVLRAGGWREVPMLLRGLEAVLDATGLPGPVKDALAIWTFVAGQPRSDAPAPMAFVPALIHGPGAWRPRDGMSAIPDALAAAAAGAGVSLRCGMPVRQILVEQGVARGVLLEAGEQVPAEAVVSDCGIATYLRLLPRLPPQARRKLEALPLQSPGLGAYLAVRGARGGSALRFRLDAGRCRLFVDAAAGGGEAARPARLVAPLDHGEAERLGPAGQRERLEVLLEEPWWREGLTDVRVVARRVPADWGRAFRLHRDAMNPVMTARLMRRGRLPHRSPWLGRLYLAGSSTHPGQWVSFAAISGILAADAVREDLG